MSFAEGVPTVTLELGGKRRALAWTWGARRRVKEQFDPSTLDLNDHIALVDRLPQIIWASLDSEDRAELSAEDIEDMIHPGNEVEIIEKATEMFMASEPEQKEESGGNAQPAASRKATAGEKKKKKHRTSTSSGRSESLTSG